MREISLHIMDIAQNSIKANCKNINIEIDEDIEKDIFQVKIIDDGDGIDEEMLSTIKDPFSTTRTERKVGLGLSLFEAACLRCEGYLEVYSERSKGTKVIASMKHNHIDRMPLGRIEETLISILMNQQLNLTYKHKIMGKEFALDSREIRAITGECNFSIETLMWIKGYILENLEFVGVELF